jgi:hypothetical protein
VLNAGGEVTVFWASENEAAGVRFDVIAGASRESARVRLEQLEIAERTGELTVSIDGLNALGARRVMGDVDGVWRKVDLWDKRRA